MAQILTVSSTTNGTVAARLIGRVSDYFRMRRDERQLLSAPDYLLSDIGIGRGDIERVVRGVA